nr:cysteine proteinase inhibitor 5 [Quercus suber]
MEPQKKHCLYFLLTLMILPIYSSTALGGKSGGGVLVGGWQPIKNITEPHVKEIGEYAVEEYNKESKSQLKFVSVVKGETQVVAGTNYRLILATKDGALAKNYQAVVWEKSRNDVKAVEAFCGAWVLMEEAADTEMRNLRHSPSILYLGKLN